MNKLLKHSFFRYAFVGGSGFVVDYAIFLLVLSGLEGALAEPAANIAGMAVGAIWCFLLNRLWSFKSKGKITVEAGRYLALLIFNMAASSGLLAIITSTYGFDPRFVKAALMVVIFLWNFLISRFWIFTVPKKTKEQKAAEKDAAKAAKSAEPAKPVDKTTDTIN